MPDEISYFYPAFSFITSLFFRFNASFSINFLPFFNNKNPPPASLPAETSDTTDTAVY